MLFDLWIKTNPELEETKASQVTKLFSHTLIKCHIIKDPIEVNYNIYKLEMQFDKVFIDMIKLGYVDCFILRFAQEDKDRSIDEDALNIDENANILCSMYLKPLHIKVEPSIDSDVAKVELTCVTLYVYSLLKDKYFCHQVLTNIPTSTKSDSVILSPKANIENIDLNINSIISNKTVATQNLLGNSNIRSIKNNNLGNIRASSKNNWQGEVDIGDTAFESFATPELGVRASAILVKNHIKGGADTLEKLINKWAPPTENNTNNYIDVVTKQLGWTEEEARTRKLTDADIGNILAAKALMEGGAEARAYFSNEVLQEGLRLANINATISANSSNYTTNTKQLNPDTTKNVNPLTLINGKTAFDNGSPLLPSKSNSTGKDFFRRVLEKLNEKYNIIEDEDNNLLSHRSNYVYSRIVTPTLNVIEYIKYLHKWFPIYKINIPWIIDDAMFRDPLGARHNDNVTIKYREINILDDSIRTKIDIGKTTQNLIRSLSTVVEVRNYYDNDSADQIKNSMFLFKDSKGTQTTFNPDNTDQTIMIPQTNDITSDNLKNLYIPFKNLVEISANYDAVEFKDRFELLKTHVSKGPRLFKIKFLTEHLAFLDFNVLFIVDAIASNATVTEEGSEQTTLENNVKKKVNLNPLKIQHTFSTIRKNTVNVETYISFLEV